MSSIWLSRVGRGELARAAAQPSPMRGAPGRWHRLGEP